ncbi:MAG: hypothetical protein J2P27_12200, partial [Actinobacteria bacterium]|nr:hypothetical protein [Actinomycetota bacterium]
IGGIGDNFQLQTLLAARLIGDPDAGWLPGVPLTAEMIAAADGSGEPQPRAGIAGRFNLVDPSGAWIWNEGRPADIPLFEDERVVILDPPPYERTWNTGRIYPLMQPTLRVDGQLPPHEAASWLAKARPASDWQDAAASFVVTDDLSIALPPGRTAAELVDLVLRAVLEGTPDSQIERMLLAEFGLTVEDASAACERVFGGLVRAATGNPANRPDPQKDPIASESYQRGCADPTLITRIYPNLR